MRRAVWLAVAGVVLAAFSLLADHSVADKSTTFDEMAHLTAGYSYWLTGDYRLHSGNGRLPQQWDAFPLTRYAARFPALDGGAWQRADVFPMGYRFFYEEGNDLARMLRSGRRANLLFAVLLGALIFAWSLTLFGPGGATLSLLLFVLDPNVIAHARLITSDMAAALTFTAALAAVGWCVERPGPLRAGVATLGLTALALSKPSWILVLPMIGILIVVRSLLPEPLEVRAWRWHGATTPLRKLIVLAIVAIILAALVWVGIWAAHGFRYHSVGMETDVHDWARLLPEIPSAARLLDPAHRNHWLPESYLWGIGFVLRHAQSRQTFLLGSYSSHGWWYFFPLAFLMKTPVAALALLVSAVGIGWLRLRGCDPRERRAWASRWMRRLAPLLVLLVVYWLVAISGSLNIGVRHLLPTYGAMYILAGANARWITRAPRRAVWPALALLVGLVGVESLRIHPHYLAFFNVLAGGPARGYTRLVDSNLDWGQDLPGLARRLGQSDLAGTPAYLSYFGTGRPSYYGIQARELPGFFDLRREVVPDLLGGGTYCVSATNLQTLTSPFPHLRGPWNLEHETTFRRLQHAMQRARQPAAAISPEMWRTFEAFRFARLTSYLRQRKPDESIGYSILIFHLSDAEVAQAMDGPLAELQAVP